MSPHIHSSRLGDWTTDSNRHPIRLAYWSTAFVHFTCIRWSVRRSVSDHGGRHTNDFDRSVTNSFSILNRRMSNAASCNCFTESVRHYLLCEVAQWKVKTDRPSERRWPLALCRPLTAPLSLNETNGINDVSWSIGDVTRGPGINLTHDPCSALKPLADRASTRSTQVDESADREIVLSFTFSYLRT